MAFSLWFANENDDLEIKLKEEVWQEERKKLEGQIADWKIECKINQQEKEEMIKMINVPKQEEKSDDPLS